MPHHIYAQSYGKSRVRLTKVDRDSSVHRITELSIDVELDGQFDDAYVAGDNSALLPTDTMKNVVYAFARELDPGDMETFAWTLASYFVENFDHISQASVKLTAVPWQRAVIEGAEHPHAFIGGASERNNCQVVVTKTSADEASEGAVECGLDGLVLLKTTNSGFAGFLTDEFTTLAETDDRIMATSVSARWVYNDTPDDWQEIRKRIRAVLIREFAARFSPSVQATLYEMASAVLDAEPVVEEVSLEMPNLHHHLVDLTNFDLDNPNVLFVPTDEPHGVIRATITRRQHDDQPHEHQ